MDPNAALTSLRNLTEHCLDTPDDDHSEDWADDAREALHAFADPDHWLSTGGFLPGSWARRP